METMSAIRLEGSEGASLTGSPDASSEVSIGGDRLTARGLAWGESGAAPAGIGRMRSFGRDDRKEAARTRDSFYQRERINQFAPPRNGKQSYWVTEKYGRIMA